MDPKGGTKGKPFSRGEIQKNGIRGEQKKPKENPSMHGQEANPNLEAVNQKDPLGKGRFQQGGFAIN